MLYHTTESYEFWEAPLGACLVGPDGEVLLTHQSIDVFNHAEASLARLAVTHYSLPFLWRWTLYTSWEPCLMCCGTIYWANIGRCVFGASNETLMALTGKENPQNLGKDMSMREFLTRGKKDIEIFEPFDRDEPGDVKPYGEGGMQEMIREKSKPHF